jgi:hypothetical protein
MSKIKKVLIDVATPAVKTAEDITKPRFRKALDLSPDTIKDGSDEYKRECVTRVENRRDTALKYSAFFAVAGLVYLFIFGFMNAISTLRGIDNPLGRLDVVQIFMPLIILPSLVAVFMRPRAVILCVALYAILAAYFIVVWHFLIVIPFAVAGSVIYIRLSNVIDAHYALAALEGYPDFMPLSEDIINVNHTPPDTKKDIEAKSQPISRNQAEG